MHAAAMSRSIDSISNRVSAATQGTAKLTSATAKVREVHEFIMPRAYAPAARIVAATTNQLAGSSPKDQSPQPLLCESNHRLWRWGCHPMARIQRSEFRAWRLGTSGDRLKEARWWVHGSAETDWRPKHPPQPLKGAPTRRRALKGCDGSRILRCAAMSLRCLVSCSGLSTFPSTLGEWNMDRKDGQGCTTRRHVDQPWHVKGKKREGQRHALSPPAGYRTIPWSRQRCIIFLETGGDAGRMGFWKGEYG